MKAEQAGRSFLTWHTEFTYEFSAFERKSTAAVSWQGSGSEKEFLPKNKYLAAVSAEIFDSVLAAFEYSRAMYEDNSASDGAACRISFRFE